MKIIKDNELCLLLTITDETLCDIMDNEWDKPIDSMDIDLIDLCGDVIYYRHFNKFPVKTSPVTPSSKKIIKTVVILAAVLSMLAASMFIADADIFMDLKHAIMTEFDRDKQIATIDPANSNTTPNGYALTDTNLFNQIADLGITPVTLPEIFTNGEYDVSDLRKPEFNSNSGNPSEQITFRVTKNKIVGAVTVIKSDVPYSNSDMLDIEDADEYAVNGMDVLLIKHKKSYSIHYYDSTQSVKYSISLTKCPDDEAKAIVESIK